MTIEAQKTDEFDSAFAEFASPDDKKPAEAAAAGADGGEAAAAPGGEDGAEAAASAGDGSSGVSGDSSAGGAGDAGGDQGASGEAEAGADAAQDASSGQAGEAGAAGGAAVDGDVAGQADGDAGAAVAAGVQTEAGPSADDILAGLKKLVGDVKPEPAPDAGAAKDEAPAIYTKDEEAFLAKYNEDWADVSKGEELKRKAEYQALLQYVFQQVAEFVKPLQETADVIAERTFRSELTSTVPDYSDNLREQVVGWVKTQPAYLQVAYNHVITEGSVDEVKDLIDRYRASTGQARQAPTQKRPRENELSDTAKKAAEQLAPVDSKRSGVQAPSDPSNFEDAWKQALNDLG